MITLKGKGVCSGIAIGEIEIYRPFIPNISQETIRQEDVPGELQRYEAAMAASCSELSALEALTDTPESSAIISVHLDLLNDPSIDESVRGLITESRFPADRAADLTFEQSAGLLESCGDDILAERAADLRDVKRRFLRNYAGEKEASLSRLSRPVILAAHDLLPSETAVLDRKNVLGIVTEIGGMTSHLAILAKSYDIPAVLGVSGLMESAEEAMPVILNGGDGSVILAPDGDTRRAMEAEQARHLREKALAAEFMDKPGATADGVPLQLGVNIGSSRPEELEGTERADYVGLFRTEFLYMNSGHMPTEEEQFEAYKKALLFYAPRPVTLRTLDIGGDKSLPYYPLPHEENPFLGCRAFRLCMEHRELFRTQLRAALRASAYGNLWLMIPMIGSLDDIRRAKEALAEVRAELDAERIPYSGDVKFGIMIEVPAIALIADKVAREVDFASVGTNDLCQYLTAADRGNPGVARYYQSYHPALFRVLRFVSECFQQAQKPLSVCGELGGDRLAAPVLAGMGFQKLSMPLSSLPYVKQALAGRTMPQLQSLAEAVCASATAEEAENYMR